MSWNEICISVSNFFVHPDYPTIRPRYHCVAPYHPPITEEGWQAWMDEMAARTADATMLFWLVDRERNSHGDRFRDRQVHYLKFGGARDDLLAHGVDLTRTVPGAASVPVMALMAALYMGFHDVYLLGCDHDWLLHLHESRHFYEETESALVRARYDENADNSVETQCRFHLDLCQQYKDLIRLGVASGTRIHNATPGGLLDVFPRVSLEVVLAGGV